MDSFFRVQPCGRLCRCWLFHGSSDVVGTLNARGAIRVFVLVDVMREMLTLILSVGEMLVDDMWESYVDACVQVVFLSRDCGRF